MDTELNSLHDFTWYTNAGAEKLDIRGVLPSDIVQILDHYSEVPVAVSLPFCLSWSGQAMFDITTHMAPIELAYAMLPLALTSHHGRH